MKQYEVYLGDGILDKAYIYWMNWMSVQYFRLFNVQYIPWHVLKSIAPLNKQPFGWLGALILLAVQKHSVPYSGPISFKKSGPVENRYAFMPRNLYVFS